MELTVAVPWSMRLSAGFAAKRTAARMRVIRRIPSPFGDSSLTGRLRGWLSPSLRPESDAYYHEGDAVNADRQEGETEVEEAREVRQDTRPQLDSCAPTSSACFDFMCRSTLVKDRLQCGQTPR